MKFKRFINEKTFSLNRDVDYLFNKYMRDDLKKIHSGNVGSILKKKVIINSSELKTPEAKHAHNINPINIVIGVGGFFYDPILKKIDIGFNSSAVNFLMNNGGGNIESAVSELVSYGEGHRKKEFRAEFEAARIKGSIYHELAHWIDDTLHGGHLIKMVKKANTYGESGKYKKAKEIKLRGKSSIFLTDYEINGQIHSIKQLKRSNRDLWDLFSFEEMVDESPALRTIRNDLNTQQYKEWKKLILKRMYREHLVGKEMR